MAIIGPENIQDVGYDFINLETDFPAPSGGIIQLQPATIYDLKLGNVTVANSLRWPEDGNCKIQNGVITYTDSGTLFDSLEMGDNVKRLHDVTIICTGGGTVFDCTGTTPEGALVIDNMLIKSAGSLGMLSGITFSAHTIRMLSFGTGLELNNMSLVDMTRIQMAGTNQSTTFLNFTGTTQGKITLASISPEINTNEYLFDFNTGITYDGVSCTNTVVAFSGSADKTNIFASGSNTQKTIGFNFSGGVHVPRSTVSAIIGFQDNTTETVIDQELVPVRINGTYTDGFEERTTYTSDGKIIYTGLEDTTIKVDAYVSIEPVTGVNVKMGVYLALTHAETYEVTFTNGTNTVNRVGHGLENGTSIRLSTTNTLPAEMRDDQFYWVVNKTDDTFQVSRTEGGAAYSFTDDGTGTHYYSLGGVIETCEMLAEPSINESENITVGTNVEWSTGDYVEVFTDNHDSTSNIVGISVNFIVSKG